MQCTHTTQARQALHIGEGGGDAFLASSLDAQQQTLEELRLARAPIERLACATEAFAADTQTFLRAAGTLATASPVPQAWMQVGPTTPPVPTPIPVAEHVAAWFEPSMHRVRCVCVLLVVGTAAEAS